MKLGQVLSLTRGNQIDIADEKQYVIAGVQNGGKGVLNKRRVTGTELKMKKYQVIEENQLMWCKVDTKNGAFGVTTKDHVGSLASTNMALAAIDTKKIKPEFISALFQIQGFHEHITKYSSGTTNRQYLTPTQLFELIEIPDWSIAKQEEFLVRLDLIQNSPFFAKIEQQLAHLTQLRQALLREAMQGQLLPQDPTDEPAAVLLQQLQAAAKPGKKGRGSAGALFAEAAEAVEGPFEIPASWVWCELKKVVKSIFDGPFGSHLKTADYTTAGVRVIRLENLDYGKFKHDKTTYISLEKYEGLKQHTIYKGDIIVGSFIADGVKAVLIPELGETAIAKADCFCIRHNPDAVDNQFLTYLLSTEFISDGYLRIMRGMTRSRINTAQLKQTLIPLPPLAEQHRIVAKLAQLLQHCDALEQRIRESRRLAEQLLATALREALSPPTGTNPPDAAELEIAEAETPTSHSGRATSGKQRKVPASLGPLFD